MPIKHPIRYELTPKELDTGTHWITLELENIGDEALQNIDVKINSVDSYNLAVIGTGQFISELKQNVESILNFQVSALRSSDIYITLRGRKNGDYFYWESPMIRINVVGAPAEIRTLFALTHPYTIMGETLEAEATLTGKTHSEGLDLEFWVDTPSGDFKELARIETKELEPGEDARYSAEITPDEEGIYTIYTYLYDEGRLVDRSTDTIWVEKE